VGFHVLDAVSASLAIRFRKRLFRPFLYASAGAVSGRLVLVKPLTYMNRSGAAIPAALRMAAATPEELVVVCDTLDLPPGSVRLKRKGSAGGHNGVASIMDELGTGDFMRLYVGIGHPGSKEAVIEHVLGEPDDAERQRIAGSVERAAEAVLMLREHKPEHVMNAINRKASGS
jgi:PTH1 family peptidyl-tRNA hydrolase